MFQIKMNRSRCRGRGIVGKLIGGCEKIIVQKSKDFKTEMSDECSKLVAECLGSVGEELRTSEDRIEKRLEEMIDQKMKAKDSEIDTLKSVVREFHLSVIKQLNV